MPRPLETFTFGNPVKILWVDIALTPCTCRFGCKAPATPVVASFTITGTGIVP